MTPRDSAGVSRASSKRPPGDFFTEWQQCEGDLAPVALGEGDVALVIDVVVVHDRKGQP